MAAPAPDFINEFETAVNNLEAITEANVNESIDKRTQFTTSVLAGLTDINAQIQSVTRRLTKFRASYNDMQARQSNYSQAITRLNEQSDRLQAQFDEFTARNNAASAAIEKQLNECQTARAQLEAENQHLTEEITALREQLRNLVGQQGPGQDKELIQQLTDQMQALNAEITANNQRIAQLDGENRQLQQQIAQNDAAQQAQINGHEANAGALQQQITELTAARDDLQARIRRANPILERTLKFINDLVRSPPLPGQVNQFNDSLDEIKQNLQTLNALIPNNFDDSPGRGSGSGSGLGGLTSGIGSLFGSNSSSASQPADLVPASVENTGTATLGGKKFKKIKKTKKTKKVRKQKGGYIYKEIKKGGFVIKTKKNRRRSSSKRSSTRSARSARSSTRTSRTRTSRNSINY
jgi:predicted  nucleic acid-binding Zn-ribbon protein